jgi:two-component system LytT family response regulator
MIYLYSIISEELHEWTTVTLSISCYNCRKIKFYSLHFITLDEAGTVMMNVMLVEPDLTALTDLYLFLHKDLRFQMISRCTDPTIVWVEYQKMRPDVIFLNIDISNFNGLALAEKIRRKYTQTIIILLSANPSHALNAYQVFPLDFLIKPVNKARLQRTIDRIFQITSVKDDQSPFKRDPTIHVRCFGHYCVSTGQDQQEAFRLPTRQTRDILAFFLTRYDQTVSREEILENLFHHHTDKKSINLLHVTIYKLRQALNLNTSGQSGISITGLYRIQVAPGICDLIDFARMIRRNQPINSDNITEMVRIASLYRGPCFEQEDYPWAEVLRAEMEVAYERLLLRIAAFRLTQCQIAQSEETLKTLVGANPYSEEGNCALLDLYLSHNNRRKFVSHFETYNRILTEELNVMIDRQYMKAYREFRQN